MPSKTKALTPAERVVAMKERVEEAKRIKEEAAAEKQRRKEAAYDLRGKLVAELRSLSGIPVIVERDGKRVKGTSNVTCDDLEYGYVVLVSGWNKGHVSLIEFHVCHDGEAVRILHDDTPVSLDVAVDLAVAAVEAAFDAEGE